ncbi:MAG: hypothetical protein K1X88_14215 [Nannocystaceae bacterium]|nr:hypothetical protein [Nannocystaceae bacterium]
MTEIAQLFESALRASLSRAAMNTLAQMPPTTALRELLESDAGEALRALTLRELGLALQQAGYQSRRGSASTGRRRMVESPGPSRSAQWEESREERVFREILAALEHEALTIGQLSKKLGVDTEELRGYLAWMKKAGKVVSAGKARATRYSPAR